MTDQAQEDLAGECARVAEVSGKALAWVEDPANAELVGAETKSLVHQLRRGRRRAARLGRSASRPMSVSVFGPSQAGKSFLVSVLARPADGPLVADFDAPNGTLDYIREINPEGEGESTGLVTRFTMDRESVPDGFPVRLTLLSEADIVRTLVNSFFMDGDRSEPSPEPGEIAAHIDAFKAKTGPGRPGLEADELYDIQDYVQGSFGREAYAAALKPFWEEAAQIAPGLSIPDRAAFFVLLWGGHQPFSDLYIRMAEALAQLDHAEEVFAGMDALVPRENSIIDVKTLSGEADGAPLSVATPGGKQVTLPRSVICALAAELVVPMQTQPSPLFAETDLLDFPGARNRFEQTLKTAFAKDADAILPELLLRGKVAYLFDRYVQNQEITSMLLCVQDSNMETVDLPGLVQGWIATTHGETPAQRTQTDTALFWVFTKFDKHLGDSAAEGGDDTRFERRIGASLLEKFGKGSDPWVAEWTPGRAFDNCFWLRNPNYFVEGLIEYDAAWREIRIRPEKEARLAELRAGCLSAPSVQRHFAEPEAAWDAALALNDGGVSYLMDRLARVCKPDAKLRQIRAQLDKVAEGLRLALAPFYVSDDVEARVAEKKEAAHRVIDDLEEALTRHRFGAVLAALGVDQDEIESRIGRVPSSVRITSAVSQGGQVAAPGPSAGPATPARPPRPGLQRPGGGTRPRAEANAEPDATTQTVPEIRSTTLERFQADTAVEIWIDGLKRFRDAAALRRAFGVSDAAAADLVAELIHAARRTGLGARTAQALDEISFGVDVEKQAQPAAILCAESINHFVTTLGMDALPEAERPQVNTPDGGTRPIFAPRAVSDSPDNLPEQPLATAEALWTDWVFGLDALFEANAKDGIGGEIDVDRNLALGRILGALEGQAA